MSPSAKTARSGPPAWPWPADTPLDRARRVAQSYRAAAAIVDPETIAALDAWAVDHGQGWVVGHQDTYDEDELLTVSEAADWAHVQVRTVYMWHRRGLPYTDTVDGIRVRKGDLVTWLTDRRQARLTGSNNPTT